MIAGQQTWRGWLRARARRETRPGQRTEAWLGGEERADRWAPSVSDGKRGCGVTRAGLGERERGSAGPRGLREAGACAGRLCGGSVRAGPSGKEEFGFLGRVFLLFFLG